MYVLKIGNEFLQSIEPGYPPTIVKTSDAAKAYRFFTRDGATSKKQTLQDRGAEHVRVAKVEA